MIETKFKNTEIGPIPTDWEVKTLGEIMTIKSGDSITGDQFLVNGQFPVYGGNGIRGHINSYNLDGEYILIGRVGALCGNIHITKGKSFASEHALICYPINGYCTQFVAPILKGMSLGQYSGASAQPVLAAKKLLALSIAVPPLAEQEAIGEALREVDELIEGLKKLVAKKRAIKQGAMSQLLSGKSRLPGFSEPWKEVTLAEIGDFYKGKGIARAEAMSGTIPAIRYGEIYTHHNDYIREFNSFISKYVANNSFRLNQGDICFAGSGETLEEIGKAVAYIHEHEAYAGGDIVILRPKKNICSLFLGFAVNMPEVAHQKANKGSGVSIMHITAKGLADIFVNIPTSLAEQEAIAKVLTDMDAEIEALSRKVAKYEQVKQGMMQQLLTGKIRLI